MPASFADVRDFAVSGEGPCCTDGKRLEDLMTEVLWTFWSNLPAKDRRTSGTIVTVVGQSDYTISGGASRISNLSFGSCQLMRRDPPCTPCDPEAGTGGRGKPVTWSIAFDGKVSLWPTPDDVYTIHYDNVDYLDPTLYTEEDDVRTWNLIPFPEPYHAIYKTMVRAKAVLESDPARGVMLYNSALADLRTIITDRVRDFEADRGFILNRDARKRRRVANPEGEFRWELPADYVFAEY